MPKELSTGSLLETQKLDDNLSCRRDSVSEPITLLLHAWLYSNCGFVHAEGTYACAPSTTRGQVTHIHSHPKGKLVYTCGRAVVIRDVAVRPPSSSYGYIAQVCLEGCATLVLAESDGRLPLHPACQGCHRRAPLAVRLLLRLRLHPFSALQMRSVLVRRHGSAEASARKRRLLRDVRCTSWPCAGLPAARK